MPSASPSLLVAGLCAQWCGTCRDYLPLFEQQTQRFTNTARFVWIDIEDHAEVLGTIDVEDFPTLLIARGDEVLFFGTVTPHANTLGRLVQSAADGDLKPLSDAGLAGLPQRVRAAMP
ncbi:thioredoxin family protein [Piscinibacter sp.]|uniref:thioredoxin family protein n=1 Tax=Piscinibacter sp. TaxID=1903157 RepID=UPI002C883369|nr:thioredoxin family protein [Albitalea sp.]HUG22526.1 thioredoxin family protein [Albitalea sp.]